MYCSCQMDCATHAISSAGQHWSTVIPLLIPSEGPPRWVPGGLPVKASLVTATARLVTPLSRRRSSLRRVTSSSAASSVLAAVVRACERLFRAADELPTSGLTMMFTSVMPVSSHALACIPSYADIHALTLLGMMHLLKNWQLVCFLIRNPSDHCEQDCHRCTKPDKEPHQVVWRLAPFLTGSPSCVMIM